MVSSLSKISNTSSSIDRIVCRRCSSVLMLRRLEGDEEVVVDEAEDLLGDDMNAMLLDADENTVIMFRAEDEGEDVGFILTWMGL